MQNIPRPWLTFGFLGLLSAAGCGMASSDEASSAGKDSPTPPGTATGAGGSGSISGSSPGAAGGGGGVAPPEMEVEKAFETPVATERYVWAANPKTNRVALIDAQTFQVKTVAAGQGPTFLAAIPGKDDRAIVLNVLSSDATYMSQRADGQLDVRTYQLAPRANSWAISPDARWAIAWTDISRVARPDSVEGFQQISIIDLNNAVALSRVPVRTVGFRPSRVAFAADPPRALAVTEVGITVIDLSVAGDPRVLRTIKLEDSSVVPFGDPGAAATLAAPQADASSDSGDPDDAAPDADDAAVDAGVDGAGILDAAADRDAASDAAAERDAQGDRVDAGSNPPSPGKADVSITPKGDYAIFRREGSAVVTVIDLNSAARWSWTLAGAVTDLDLADTGDRAVAVIRDANRVAVLPVPGSNAGGFDDLLVSGETVGSVVIAPQGNVALLYTNAVAINRLTVIGLTSSPTQRVINLHAPVLSVFPSPTANHGVVVHNSFKGTAFQSPGAFSLVALSDDQAPVIQATDAPIQSVALSPGGDHALVPVRDDRTKIYGVYLARMPSLVVVRYPMFSPPSSAGFVGSAGQAFIAQEHPAGRVSFIDPITDRVRTITGFELGASVVEWSRTDGGQ